MLCLPCQYPWRSRGHRGVGKVYFSKKRWVGRWFSVSYVLHQEEHTVDVEVFFVLISLRVIFLCLLPPCTVHFLASNSTLSPGFTTGLLHLLGSCHVLSSLPLDPILSSLHGCIPVVNTVWPLASVSGFSRPLQSSFACTFGVPHTILFLTTIFKICLADKITDVILTQPSCACPGSWVTEL